MQRMESSQLEPSTFQTRLTVARALLNPKTRREPVWPVVASLMFFVVCLLGLAGTIITAPIAGSTTPAKAPAGKFTPVVEDKRG